MVLEISLAAVTFGFPPVIAKSLQVRLHHILLHHALGVKEGAVDGDGPVHGPHKGLPVMVIQGDDDVLQFPKEAIGIAGAIIALGTTDHRGADGPTGEILAVPLQPAFSIWPLPIF